jgi:hypothetical protein
MTFGRIFTSISISLLSLEKSAGTYGRRIDLSIIFQTGRRKVPTVNRPHPSAEELTESWIV